MAVRLVVAVTDYDWFTYLSNRPDLDEVNFWSPSGTSFRALEPGELFLFKLHSPRNFIVGAGVFVHANRLPCSLAWEAFGERNGAVSLRAMRARIAHYRHQDPASPEDFEVGCRILTQPVFLSESEWIAVPESWSARIVTFKGYSTDEPDGLRLWEAFESRLGQAPVAGFAEPQARYGEPALVRPRLGQGGFRVLVTDSYRRRCAVTQERTLPALDAAHIVPFADGGEHKASNGILLRRDIHGLFDAGYVTITPERHFEVSRRIHEDFDNGQDYYELHGRLVAVPDAEEDCPDPVALRWHNDTQYKG